MAGENWKSRTLDDCATFGSGGTPSKSRADFWTGTIPWVSAKDLKVFRLHDAEDHVTPEAVDAGSRLARAGSIFLLVRGMTLHNDVPICVAMRDMAFNQDIKALIPKAGVDGGFLTYWLLSQKPALLSSVDSAGHGTGRLNTDTLKAMAVSLPSLAEQKAIAAVLGALDDKIELNRRMNATLEAMARALFQSWFVDFDPVRAKLDGRPPAALDPATAALFPASFQDSALGHIPKGWEINTLGSILDVLETGRRPKGGVGSYTSGVPSVGAESINGIGVFDYSKTKYIPLEFFEKTSSGRVAHFDVLLYKDGGKPGEFRPRVGLFGHDFPFKTFCINEHVFRMRSVRTGQSFLFFTTSHQRVLDDFANKGGKAAIPSINQPDVKSTPIVLPPKEITDAFNARADLLCDQILHNAIQSRTLATLRDTLLPKLLSGELSVAETTSRIGEAL